MSDGKLRRGQLMFGSHQIPVQFTEQIMDDANAYPLLGDAHTEISPNDQDSSKVKIYATPDLSDYWLSYAGIERRMRIPDTLTDLTISYEEGGSASSYSEIGENSTSGDYSVGQSCAAQCQAAASVIPKLIHSIREIWSFNPPVTHYFYFGSSFSQSDILGKLSAKLGVTVNPWPIFKPESLVFKVIAQRNNATARTTFQGSVVARSGGASAAAVQGSGDGFDDAPNIQDVQLPATLHSSFSLTGTDTTSNNAVATFSIAGSVITFGGGKTATASATGSITPTSVSATSPPGIPSSGLYLFDFDIEPAETFGEFYAHAVVFDFGVLA